MPSHVLYAERITGQLTSHTFLQNVAAHTCYPLCCNNTGSSDPWERYPEQRDVFQPLVYRLGARYSRSGLHDVQRALCTRHSRVKQPLVLRSVCSPRTINVRQIHQHGVPLATLRSVHCGRIARSDQVTEETLSRVVHLAPDVPSIQPRCVYRLSLPQFQCHLEVRDILLVECVEPDLGMTRIILSNNLPANLGAFLTGNNLYLSLLSITTSSSIPFGQIGPAL